MHSLLSLSIQTELCTCAAASCLLDPAVRDCCFWSFWHNLYLAIEVHSRVLCLLQAVELQRQHRMGAAAERSMARDFSCAAYSHIPDHNSAGLLRVFFCFAPCSCVVLPAAVSLCACVVIASFKSLLKLNDAAQSIVASRVSCHYVQSHLSKSAQLPKIMLIVQLFCTIIR